MVKKNLMQSHGKKTESITRKTAFMGLMLALALILSYVESLIPFNFGVPGIKLGLPNLCTVLILYLWGPMEALGINCLRILLAGFMFGNMSMIMYSLAGAALSFAVMLVLMKTSWFGIGGVSLAGGVMHNVGQCIIACIVVENYRISFYLPFLLVAGAVTGLIIGYIAQALIPTLKKLFRQI